MNKAEIEFDPLYALPQDWKWRPLEDLIGKPKQDIVDGPFGSNLKASEYTNHGVPIARLQNIDRNMFIHKNIKFIPAEKAEELGRHNFKAGDILITKLGDPLGKACIVPKSIAGGIIVADLVRVRTGHKEIDSHYLMYALNSPFLARQFEKHTKGTTRPRVNLGIVRSLPIPVAPTNQQTRIVAEIEKQFSRLDEAIATLKRVKANLKRYKAAVLKAAVEGKFAPTAGPWKQVALGDVTTSIRNGYSKKPDAEQGTRIFRISAVRPMKLDANDVRYLSGTPADYEPFLVEPGDVLFTRYNGNRDYVGVCARVPTNLSPTVYPDKLIRVRVPHLMMLPEFLVILASTGRAREFIESKIRTTAGQSGISGGDLKSLPMDIPPLAEQQQIVAEVERRLSVIAKLDATVESNRTRADRLRQAILRRSFSGSLI